MYANQVHAYCLQRPEESARFPGIEVTSHGCLKLNLDPLQEQPDLLSTEPSFQPSRKLVLNSLCTWTLYMQVNINARSSGLCIFNAQLTGMGITY